MEHQPNTMKKSIITGAIFFVLDALVMNQGAISLFLIFTIILWWLPKSAFKKHTKQSPKEELTKILIYGFIVIAVFTSNSINNKIAQNRANDLVLIIENFHQVTGDYPKTLNDLVPLYLPKVLQAKYTLSFNSFKYINDEGSVSLFYHAIPPFGRPTYVFDRKEWIYLD
ncbi:MAG: hypothetical protein Q7T96_02260 [Methylobacter sp.]|nr:hypothetical protein [Methylobacter sp.]